MFLFNKYSVLSYYMQENMELRKKGKKGNTRLSEGGI